MKLLQIQIRKSTANNQVQNIKHTIALKVVGYVNLISRRRVQCETVSKEIAQGFTVTCTQVQVFATSAAAKLYKGIGRAFNQCFAQAGIFESKISQAKKALKDAKKMMLTTQEYFLLHVNLCRAYLHLRSFKYSLPGQIVNLLF